ncbi:diguanylate cyclase, partial [Aduncisulcus paluster]
AQVIAERIRQEVEGLEISKSLGVTASVGCSQWVVSEYLESWFARTDKALYVSKNTGKNKITVSDSETEKDVFVKVYWSDSWNSGHPAIDAEHKNLLERCNSIIESSLGHSTYDETLRNVDVFLADMKKHFSNEIDILRERNYPEVDKHEVIHENLLNKAHELCSKAVNDDVTTGELFTFLLLTVMKYHINGEDINYFDYL